MPDPAGRQKTDALDAEERRETPLPVTADTLVRIVRERADDQGFAPQIGLPVQNSAETARGDEGITRFERWTVMLSAVQGGNGCNRDESSGDQPTRHSLMNRHRLVYDVGHALGVCPVAMGVDGQDRDVARAAVACVANE